MDKIIAHLGIMPYVVRFSEKFLLARWSVSYLLVYTWHTLLHYPHGANAGCDLAGVAPVLLTLVWFQRVVVSSRCKRRTVISSTAYYPILSQTAYLIASSGDLWSGAPRETYLPINKSRKKTSNFYIIYFCLLCHTPRTHKRIIFYINMPLLLKKILSDACVEALII